jgi:hypothetical protein
MIHVYPINDLKEHEFNSTCECVPRVEECNGEIILIHNSFDGREGVELANELLNPKS